MKNLWVLGVVVILLTTCEKNRSDSEMRNVSRVADLKKYPGLVFNDTIDIKSGECLNDPLWNTTICFDSVLSDSRCPVNVVCVWAGEATVRFAFREQGQNPQFVDLRLHTDTLLNNYQLSFVDLFPYPHTENPVKPSEYKARIVIRRK